MSKDHPNNGPSFSKAPPTKRRPADAPSPARNEAKLDETKREAAKSRDFDELRNKVGLVEALRQKGYWPKK